MCKIPPRLKVLADNEGITIGALERIIGASKGVISRAISNGTDIQSKWIQSVVENYPRYSPTWLITGEGEMIKTDEPSDDANSVGDYSRTLQPERLETRPRIPFEASAGTLSLAVNPVYASECEQVPVIPTFPRYDFSIIARGESMAPEFHSGDELACAFVKESAFIQWGHAHVLDTAQGVVLKRIFDKQTHILCRSINHEFPDFEIPKTEIYHIAIVVGLVRHF